jgi:hypothetical protein
MTRINFVNLFVCRDLILQSLTNGSEGLAYVIFVDVVLDLSDDDRELGFLVGVVRVGLAAVF